MKKEEIKNEKCLAEQLDINPIDNIALGVLFLATDLSEIIGYLRGMGIDEDNEFKENQFLFNSLVSAKHSLNEALMVLLKDSVEEVNTNNGIVA